MVEVPTLKRSPGEAGRVSAALPLTSLRRLVSLALVLGFLGWLSSRPALGGEPALVSMDQLRVAGLDPRTFQPICLSPGGRMLLGFQRGTPAQVRQGAPRTLWLIHLRSDGYLGSAQRFPLPAPAVEQAVFLPDLSGALVLTSSGASYLIVDFATRTTRPLMVHQPGVAGFRADPSVLWWAGDRLLTTGYFYDAQDYAGENVIARVDPSRQGLQAFLEGPNIERTERRLKGWDFVNYNHERLGFLGRRSGAVQELFCLEPGREPKVVDRAPRFEALWGAGDRLLYSVRAAQASQPDGSAPFELRLYEAGARAVRVLDRGPEPYPYLLLSGDGGTALACRVDARRERLTVFQGREGTGFNLQPVPGLKRVPLGMIRISPDGRRGILFSSDGLRVFDL